MKRMAALATILLLFVTITSFAQGKAAKPAAPKEKAAVTHQAIGTISSVDADKLVLSHKVKGKDEETTFVFNADTKKEGQAAAGEKATVHYKVEGTQNVATLVKVTAPMKAKNGRR